MINEVWYDKAHADTTKVTHFQGSCIKYLWSKVVKLKIPLVERKASCESYENICKVKLWQTASVSAVWLLG